MHNKLWIAIFAAAMLSGQYAGAAALEGAGLFTGQDLHLAAGRMTVYEGDGFAEADHILTFTDSFSMSIGDNQLSSNSAVVWLRTITADYRGTRRIDYNAQIYLEGNVSVKQGKGARATDLTQAVVERGEALVARFLVNGEVFATADEQGTAPVSELEDLRMYQNALSAIKPVRSGPAITKKAKVPKLKEPGPIAEPQESVDIAEDVPELEIEPGELPEKPTPVEETELEYPVNMTSLWQQPPEIEDTQMTDGSRVSTVIGRIYIWQKRDEKGGLLELQADSAVVFRGSGESASDEEQGGESIMGAGSSAKAAYLKGNIIMTEGARTVRADEMYYDFQKHQALAVNTEMRTFDEERGIPIYLRAVELRQISETAFNAEGIAITTSEFYMPQVAMEASRVLLTDTTGIDARTGKKVDKSSYDAILYDATMKVNQTPVFYWPKFRTNLERPDLPIKSMSVGRDSDFGTSVETRWHLSKLLGLKEPTGVDSVLAADYFSKRGFGGGLDIDYKQEDYFGDIIAYILKDRGTDDLGRNSDRQNLDSGEDVRGRFRFRHRHYLPYDWQATVEASYTSDENFLEWFYRNEFDTGKRQETLIHLKQLKDNWAVSLLGKFRLNKHKTVTEELPTVEFHLKGASFLDHRLTFYSDTQISRFRNRLSSDISPTDPLATASQQFYNFFSTRNEVDLPFMWNTLKIVPFVAGTYGFENQDGFFTRKDETLTLPSRDDSVFLGEVGLRMATMFWKEDQFVRSRLWDINGIRHIIKPHVEATAYYDNKETIEMRDIVNFGVSQRWQSRRGPKDNLRSFDWMRLDVDATLLRDGADSAIDSAGRFGPAKFFWNNPAISTLSRRTRGFGDLMRDSINTDYTWRLSDTTTVLSDTNFDIKSGVIQQLNIGVARYVYPDISYYIGNRYLRPIIISTDDGFEQGSNSFILAVTYALNPKYTATFAQEYNFDFGKNIKSELTLLRRYHRMYYGFTFATDESLKRRSVVFSIWPQGVKELALGNRRYIGLVGPYSED
ncbi:MAG: LPS assembly protein LptD [Planctomycetota bacterium]|jgi:hypothetical protein